VHPLEHAAVLDVPVLRTSRDSGLVMDLRLLVVVPGATPIAAIETSDQEVYRLPDTLVPWALAMVPGPGVRQDRPTVMRFPASVEFGIRDGEAFGRLTGVPTSGRH
jgi:hypothetical protein